jgi:hypothetical protein
MAAISVFTVTTIAGSGATATYTGTITSGATPLIVGTPISITGLTGHPTFVGTFLITGGNLTTTFTTANATSLGSTASAGTATYDPEGPQLIATYGYTLRELAEKTALIPLGNFVPGTLAGTNQTIIC